MEPSKLSTIGKKLFEVIEFDKDEQLIYEIRKHPFGLYAIYASGILVSLVLFGALLVFATFLDNDSSGLGTDTSLLQTGLVIGGAILSLLSLGVTYLVGYLYKSNVMIVTNEKIAQVLNRSLFDRKISQLSIGDVQDVTVRQSGLFPRLFNYGSVVIETAGEQQNYTFTYAPDPYQCAKVIVGSHEKNLKEYGN